MTEVDPRTARHLISDQGEVVIDEVRKHWAALTVPVLELAGAVIVVLLAAAVPTFWWLPVLAGLAIAAHATWRILDRRRDRFVITNMRVFRIHGILSEQIATMPLSRILDITVTKPFIGRILGFGHFVFESAAQAQGLRDIRYVGHPDERGLTIQRVIQQAGLRGYAGRQARSDAMPGPSPDGALPPLPPLRSRSSSEKDDATLPVAAYDTRNWRFGDAGDDSDPDARTTDPLDLPR